MYPFSQGENLVLFTDNIENIPFPDFVLSVGNDDFSVSGDGGNQHVGQNFPDLWNGKADELRIFSGVKLNQRYLSAGKNTVAQRIFFGQIFVNLHGNGKVRIDDGVDAHGFFNKAELIHVLRVSDSGDDPAAAQFFRKSSDDDIDLVVIGGG